MPHPPHIRIAPSILDADFGRLGEEIAAVENAGADILHLDIMDGHFVPNLSIGVPVVASVARHTGLFLDTHLMITDPAKYAPAFAEAGSKGLTFHIEAVREPRPVIDQIHDLGLRVGISLNPGTPAEAVFDLLESVDLVLVMTVWPGFGGQHFMRECLPKVEAIARRLRPDQWLEVDGGINMQTAAWAVAAGANTLVAGKAIFGGADPAAELMKLRQAASAAASTTGSAT